MGILSLLLIAGAAWAGPASPEERLRVLLTDIQAKHVQEAREAVLGSADELKDAVANQSGPAKKGMMDRFPGMAADPFNVCRELARCPEAALSMHVEDQKLINDAFIAMARPWFKLQEARGKAVAVAVDAGLGVQLKLEGLPGLESVTLEASPAPTGGFDVSLREGSAAAVVYAAERAALLVSSQVTAK
ncbi:MAG: hypothetical protein HY926_02150 [Elusimicrobia bacterium]|nr:hypothetical protein [Elusimicrobiota bacterium]